MSLGELVSKLGFDEIHSAWMSLGRLRVNSRAEFFLPDFRIGSIADLDADALVAQGFKVGMYDLDHTLMKMHDTALAQEVEGAFDDLSRKMKAIIASNCSDERFDEIGTIFKDKKRVYAIKVYELSDKTEMEQTKMPEYVCAVYHEGAIQYLTLGDYFVGKDFFGEKQFEKRLELAHIEKAQLADYKRLKKPHPMIIEFGLYIGGLKSEKRDALFFVGDRGLTDISGANQYRDVIDGVGVKPRTYQVDPIGPEFKWGAKLGRVLERFLNWRYREERAWPPQPQEIVLESYAKH